MVKVILIRKIFTVLIILFLLFLTGLFINNSGGASGEIMPFVSASGCPSECDWGCYTDRTCCPEPEPGQPPCNDAKDPI